jgi:hypothetical protein
MRRSLIGVFLLVSPLFAYAKRSSDYVAPAYGVRLLHASIGLLVLVLPIAAIVTIVARVAGTNYMPRLARSIVAVSCVVFIGAIVAAIDGLNDEGWNPALFGGPFVAFSLPVGLYFAMPRNSERRAISLAVGMFIAFVAMIGLALFGGEILHWARAQGWPVTW